MFVESIGCLAALKPVIASTHKGFGRVQKFFDVKSSSNALNWLPALSIQIEISPTGECWLINSLLSINKLF